MKKFSRNLLIFIAIVIMLVVSSGCGIIQLPFMAPTNEDLKNNVQFKWIADSTEHFHFYIEKDSWAAKNIKQVKDDSEKEYKHILELLNEPGYKNTIYYFIVKDRTRMDELIGRKTNGCAFTNRNILCAIANDSVRALGAHELFHIISWNKWGSPNDHWISEGLAVYSDNNWWGNDLYTLTKYFYEKEKLIPLKDLTTNFRSYDDLITYPEAGSIAKYIYEKYGAEKIKKFWDNEISETKNILGISLDSLEKEWISEIQKNDTKKIKYPVK